MPAKEKYAVEGPIGRGGMGEILLVTDHDLRRQIAMKVLHREAAEDDEARVHFVAEAQATSQLEHPGIPPVHDIGVAPDERIYFTMKLVRGRTLREILHDVSVRRAEVQKECTTHRLVTVLERLCETCHFAHERGVVHRDLKPANVMLGDYNRYGIARRRGMRTFLVLITLIALGRHAAGDPPAPVPKPVEAGLTPEQAADAVLAAAKAKDDAALKALAAKDNPDPWLVADALLVRVEPAAAEAFARAAPRRDVEALPAFIESRRRKPVNRAAREALAAANAALGAKDSALATVILGPLRPADDPIPAVRIAYGRGLALRGTNALADSAAAFLDAGKVAQAIGWLARASGALHEAGFSAYLRSDFRGALDAWQERVPVVEARGDRVGLARTLGNIALVSEALGNHAEALATQERALKLMEEFGDREGVSNTLGNIGNIYYSLGDYPRALEVQSRALQLRQELGSAATIAQTIGNIGNVHYALGDYARALETQERALRLKQELGDRVGVAETLGNIGLVHEALGDYPKALEYEGRALALGTEVGHRALVAAVLGNVGNVHYFLGDYPRALETHERALKLKEEIGDRTGLAMTLGNISYVHWSMGDGARALEDQERVLKLMTELGNQEGIANTLVGIGNSHQSLGHHPQALDFLTRALHLREHLGSRRGVAATLGNIASVYWALKDFPHALTFCERALAEAEGLGTLEPTLRALMGLSRIQLSSGDPRAAAASAARAVGVLGRVSTGLAEEEGSRTKEQFLVAFGIGARAARDLGDARGLAFFLESGRAATLLEALGGRNALRAFAIPGELRMEEAKARVAESIAADVHVAALDKGDRAEIGAARRTLEGAQAKVAEVIEKIQRQAKAAASVVYPKADPLDSLEGRLKGDEALVLYGVFTQDALALVVTSKAARIVPLAASMDIEEACEAEDWAKLRSLVIDPLALGDGARRLFISPMGSLCSVPFCALAPEREVVYVPSGTTYGVLLDEAGKKGDGVLALGDPDYATNVAPRDGSPLRGGRKLVPLPATRDEAKAVGDVLLLGADASVAELRARIGKRPRWHAVHLACHGLVDMERPRLSSLALSNGGFLTVLDVFRSKIPADLVVLSACETARGKVYSTEGVEGFVRAFLFAGTPRVIVSVWKVDDEATRALMTEFYRLWNPRDGARALAPATALRRAQQFVAAKEKWKEPRYWASWQLWGLPD